MFYQLSVHHMKILLGNFNSNHNERMFFIQQLGTKASYWVGECSRFEGPYSEEYKISIPPHSQIY